MKKIFKITVVVFLVSLVTLSFINASFAEEAKAKLEVVELVIAKDVQNMEPMDVGIAFTADVQKLYCFSKVKVEEEAATVYHSWYYNDEKVTQVELNVKKSPGFRTYSNKTIMSSQKGKWEVEVQDAEGNVLKSVSFTIQ
jgi:hypothetical protein